MQAVNQNRVATKLLLTKAPARGCAPKRTSTFDSTRLKTIATEVNIQYL